MQSVSVEVPFDNNGNIDIEKQKEVISKYEYVSDIRKTVTNYKIKLKELSISISSLIAQDSFTDKKISDILDSPPTNSGLKKIHVSLERDSTYNIPVYSATMNEDAIFGYVSESSRWKKYENTLTWNKDGSAGFVFHRKNKFVPYEKVKLLKIKEEFDDSLSYDYLKYVIQNRLFEEGFGFSIKCSMDKVLKLSIPVPTKEDSTFDKKRQEDISKLYDKIEEVKKGVLLELEKVFEANIDYE